MSDKLEFLTNLPNPEDPFCLRDEYDYLAQLPFPYVIGEPKVADCEGALPLEDLKRANLVGIYRVKSDET